MASATNNDEKRMATEVIVSGADEPDRRPPQREDKDSRHGFFTIYKKGQGYWTRICSSAAAGLIILLTVNFIWVNLPPLIRDYFVPNDAVDQAVILAGDRQVSRVTIAVCAAFLLGSAWVIWYLLNKPTNVDFLIATDSEMKKVNWTSKEELVGSTKVVIIFMLMIAALLFTLDMYFTRLFHQLGVLEADSPLWLWVRSGLGAPAEIALDIVMGALVFGGAAWAVYETIRSK